MDVVEVTHTEIVERVAAAGGLRTESVVPLTDMHTGTQVGELATLGGMNIDKAVGVDLHIDDVDGQMWSRTFYAFARSVALIPHLAVEWSGSGADGDEPVRVLVDLLPRIDLAVNLDYVDEVYGPLTDTFTAARGIDGVRIVSLHPRRSVAMSPWRLSLSVPRDQIEELAPLIDTYVGRWIDVNSGGVGSPVDPLASDQARLVQHDRFHRNTLFDPASDPNWERIDRTLGPDPAAELRFTLRSQRER
jgi:hypothetical protein